MIRVGIFFGVTMAVLAGLWMLMRPLAAPQQPAPTVAAASAAPVTVSVPAETTAVVPAVRRFELQPSAPGAATALQVQVGDEVELVITTTANDELHLHGYDLALPLRAGEQGVLRFVAEHAGRFELELHHAHAELAVLEVLPR